MACACARRLDIREREIQGSQLRNACMNGWKEGKYLRAHLVILFRVGHLGCV